MTEKVLQDRTTLTSKGLESVWKEQTDKSSLLILNGVYKEKDSHLATCWVNNGDFTKDLQQRARRYAGGLGYKV